MLGTPTLEKTDIYNFAEVTNISPFGFWILTNGQEFFVDYKDYPVFENASILDIASVETDIQGNLHWQNLDADIELAALQNPEDFPLVDNNP